MDLTVSAASTAVAESDPETRNTIQPGKPLVSSNGVLKRHISIIPGGSGPSPTVAYRDCLKNHAASLGGYAVDGCGEFMPSPTASPSDPTSLTCAACGCHRNFHRREPEDPPGGTPVLEYHPTHRHQPPPPFRATDSPSPPPSHPPMLFPLNPATLCPRQNCRKRFRTKFTPNQKEKMFQFAERVGWKIQRVNDEMVSRFCNELGIDRVVLKVWMHNNKNTLGKREFHGLGISVVHDISQHGSHDHQRIAGISAPVSANGSCSHS